MAEICGDLAGIVAVVSALRLGKKMGVIDRPGSVEQDLAADVGEEKAGNPLSRILPDEGGCPPDGGRATAGTADIDRPLGPVDLVQHCFSLVRGGRCGPIQPV